MATKYLYGAAVQGIQSFIFQTNELKDIVGASELVNEICTKDFDEYSKTGESIVRAAGTIKHIYAENEINDLEKTVKNFPKKVMSKAPGITVSQAVVEVDDNDTNWFENAVDVLEHKLKYQRNKPAQSLTVGFLGTDRNPKTGLPAVAKDDDGNLIDEAVQIKRSYANDAHYRLCVSAFGVENLDNRIAYKIDDITKNNDWIAIIHADGNGLGKIIQQIGGDKQTLHDFSAGLDSATMEAAKKAYRKVEKYFNEGFIPIRPIVVGGDDFTVICRADFALEYITAYLDAFEHETKVFIERLSKNNEKLKNSGIKQLTACAGIAYIKSSFPFHYGYKLAEKLCEAAKNDSKAHNKDTAPSCVMFHKVQDSFVENYTDIVDRELIIRKENDGNEIHTFQFGPYYLNTEFNGYWTTEKLTNIKKQLSSNDDGNKVKSAVRQLIGLWKSKDFKSASKKARILNIIRQYNSDLLNTVLDITDFVDRDNGRLKAYPAYDVLSLLSVENQVTKKQLKQK